MPEIHDTVFEKISNLSECANLLMEDALYPEAVVKFEQALALLPEPKTDYEAYVWLSASIGDAYFLQHDFNKAVDFFWDALNGPDGHTNPFVLLRLGQCLFETGNEQSQEFLMRAYLIEGEEIFANETDKYFQTIKGIVKK